MNVGIDGKEDNDAREAAITGSFVVEIEMVQVATATFR